MCRLVQEAVQLPELVRDLLEAHSDAFVFASPQAIAQVFDAPGQEIRRLSAAEHQLGRRSLVSCELVRCSKRRAHAS